MRTDIPSMQSGRSAAQASHAANAFVYKFFAKEDVVQWQQQTSQGFGTAIVLGTNLIDMVSKVKEASRQKFFSDIIVDPDYAITISSEILPFLDKTNQLVKLEQSPTDSTKYIIHRAEPTCGYIFGDKEELKELVGDLPLYS